MRGEDAVDGGVISDRQIQIDIQTDVRGNYIPRQLKLDCLLRKDKACMLNSASLETRESCGCHI